MRRFNIKESNQNKETIEVREALQNEVCCLTGEIIKVGEAAYYDVRAKKWSKIILTEKVLRTNPGGTVADRSW